MKGPVKLRLCASCEWIFRGEVGCPRCGFGSYGAYSAYGKKAYRYEITQVPWKEKKMLDYDLKLQAEINESPATKAFNRKKDQRSWGRFLERKLNEW
jgi:hypothetical protein